MWKGLSRPSVAFRLRHESASWLFDIIGRKRSADGGFFAVSIGFVPDGNERDDAVTRFGSSLGLIQRWIGF
jgi:hypothetical protein